MTPSALDDLAGAVASWAIVAGLGESTRFGHETFDLRDQLFRRLVRDHGFRGLAVQDDAAVGDALDAYVNGGPGTAVDALAGAWRPWRTAEMVAALEWIRGFNQEHPGDPIRIFGVKPAQAGPADYDAVLDHVRAAAPDLLADLASHLDPIRTAHAVDEHVQRARGVHPGRPFAEHARDALAIVRRLPDDIVLARMRLIADYHERSVAGRGDYAGDAHTWAATIFDRRELRVAYWDGIAHTSAAPVTLGLAPERGARPTVGSVLRERLGAGYVSVGFGFHHGDLGVARVPAPDPGWVDARLDGDGWVDLRAGDPRWGGPATVRVISGVYDPARDAAEQLAVESLPEAFDVLVHVRRVSPVTAAGS